MRRRVLIGVGVVAALVALAVGYPAWHSHRTWTQVEGAAAKLRAPAGFREIRRVKAGEGFCFVSCTGGGEAVLTVVFDPRTEDSDEACAALRTVVRQFVTRPESVPGSMGYGFRCDISGDLEGSMSVRGVAIRRGDVKCDEPSVGCGPRWMEKMRVPDLPVIVWVEFNSGIE